MSAKRSRSPSPPTIRPSQSSKRVKVVDDFRDFTNDLQDTLRRMLPTGGRRYDEAAILAIDFSVSDIPSVGKLRDELLDLLEKTYNWKIVKYTIDCAVSWTIALWNLDQAVHNFTYKYASRGQGRSLLTFCFSGHCFADKENNSIYVAHIGAERVGYRLQKHPGYPGKMSLSLFLYQAPSATIIDLS